MIVSANLGKLEMTLNTELSGPITATYSSIEDLLESFASWAEAGAVAYFEGMSETRHPSWWVLQTWEEEKALDQEREGLIGAEGHLIPQEVWDAEYPILFPDRDYDEEDFGACPNCLDFACDCDDYEEEEDHWIAFTG